MNYGVVVFDENGFHRGPRWSDIDEAVKQFVAAVGKAPKVMIIDAGDLAVAEANEGKLEYARWSLLQAPKGRWDLLRLLPMVEQQCSFTKCGEVFLPSWQPGMGDIWEREQHISSCCSDPCYERGLGLPKTIRYRVELRAFGDGAIREVKLPASQFKGKPLQELRTAIFVYGQNEKQLQMLPSVSVGDVIILDRERWIITNTGFEKEPEPVALAYDDRDQT